MVAALIAKALNGYWYFLVYIIDEMNNPSEKTKKWRVSKMADARTEHQVIISDFKFNAFVYVLLDGQFKRFHAWHQREWSGMSNVKLQVFSNSIADQTPRG